MLFLFDFFAWMPLAPRLICYGILAIASVWAVTSIVKRILEVIPFV